MQDEPKITQQVKGTRIITGELAKKRRVIMSTCQFLAEQAGFDEIVLPSLEKAEVYTDKAGQEILGQMYVFPDKADRTLCLRPEGTATCQLLAQEKLKFEKDVKLWYITTCWRYEQPQAGRYREFTQFGVEILNPTKDYTQELITLAETMVRSSTFSKEYETTPLVKRGLAYYTADGFEISCPKLGAQKQVCGGGKYKEGIGFALGVDRLMLVS